MRLRTCNLFSTSLLVNSFSSQSTLLSYSSVMQTATPELTTATPTAVAADEALVELTRKILYAKEDPSMTKPKSVHEWMVQNFGPEASKATPEQIALDEEARRYQEARRTPKPEPTDYPRSDWSATVFGIPFFPGNYRLGDQANWGCKNASLAVSKAMETGDWSEIDHVGVTLMICDKVLQL